MIKRQQLRAASAFAAGEPPPQRAEPQASWGGGGGGGEGLAVSAARVQAVSNALNIKSL